MSTPLFDSAEDMNGGNESALRLQRTMVADAAAPRANHPVVNTNKSPSSSLQLPSNCLNTAAEINSQLDTQVEVRVYPCNNNSSANHPQKKKFTQFHVKPEGVIIQGSNRHRSGGTDLGSEYASHIGRKLQRYELSDTRACQLLVTTHHKSFWVVPAPEAFSRHSGTCRLLGDRKHPPTAHTLRVGDFLRVGSVGVVVIETHDGKENRVLSEAKIQKIMKDTTNSGGNFLDLAETDGGECNEKNQFGSLNSSYFIVRYFLRCLLVLMVILDTSLPSPQKALMTLLVYAERSLLTEATPSTTMRLLLATCVLTVKTHQTIL